MAQRRSGEDLPSGCHSTQSVGERHPPKTWTQLVGSGGRTQILTFDTAHSSLPKNTKGKSDLESVSATHPSRGPTAWPHREMAKPRHSWRGLHHKKGSETAFRLSKATKQPRVQGLGETTLGEAEIIEPGS